MMKKNPKTILLLLLVFSLLPLSACQGIIETKESKQKLSSSETVFEVVLPEPISDAEEIYLEIIDDVTGIGLNPSRYLMQRKDDRSFFARIPIINGSIIKYRYVIKSDTNMIEHNATGMPVTYRLYYADRPTVIKDSVTSWTKHQQDSARGEISGFIFDKKTDLPVSDVIVSINGNNTLSGANGYFEFRNIPLGEFLLTALHIDGSYETFQQGAVIAENALTPASFGMKAAEMVDVEFVIKVPENTIEGLPVRIIGNTYRTGNLFKELVGGASVIPSRAPEMTYLGNRSYRISMQLPAGFDFRYKFTLGNGFINSERSDSGEFVTRQYVVPTKDSRVSNVVQSWSTKASDEPIRFLVSAPAESKAEESLSIQFNPYNWLPPIPMQRTEDGKWTYHLYGPLDYLDQSQFRVCRNDQCGYADDALTRGENASGFLLDVENLDQKRTIAYQVEDWYGENETAYTFLSEKYRYQKPGFIAGVAFDTEYDPYWLPYLEWGTIDAAVAGSELILLSPSWSPHTNRSNAFGNLPGESFSSIEIRDYITYAQEAGMDLVLYPTPNIEDSATYWATIDTSYNGWLDWFKSYSQMVLNYAYLSEQEGLKIITLGGPDTIPALPNGRFSDGSPSNVPYDMSDRWNTLISSVREIYSGQIIFALPSSINLIESLDFLQSVDAVMVIIDSSIVVDKEADFEKISMGAATLLDDSISSIFKTYNKPVLLGLYYSAIDGSASNCINDVKDCEKLLSDLNNSAESPPIDLIEQAMVYHAFYNQSLTRDWVIGILSMGYNPSVILRDAGVSVRGKPALDVMAYYNNNVIQD